MRIALTGATGLVGAGIVERLEDEGHVIVSVGRHPDCDVAFDLAAGKALPPGALDGCDALVHAAGIIDEDFAQPGLAQAKAHGGAAALLEACSRSGVRKLAYISSAHVYGPLEGLIDEGTATDPRTPYARAHLATETLFREAAGFGTALLVARPCAVYGPLADPARFARWSLIPFDFPRQAMAGRIVLKSAGLQRRNFVSAEGLGNLVGWWLEEAQGVLVANAPGPAEMAVYDFALLCAKMAAEEAGVKAAIERPAPSDPLPQPLQYRTRTGGHLPGLTLEDHVRGLCRALARKPST